MNSLSLVRALARHILSEAHPVYRAARRAPEASPLRLPGWAYNALLATLLLTGAILVYIERTSGAPLSDYRAEGLALALIVGSVLLSLAWVAPLAALAGQGLARELRLQTWDLLLVTPQPPGDVLLARAAGSARGVWSLAVGSAVLAALIVPAIALPAVLLTAAGLTPWTVALAGLGAFLFVAERVQEIALAVLIGVHSGLQGKRPRVAFWLGLAGGVSVRLASMALTLFVASLAAFEGTALYGLPPALAVSLWAGLAALGGPLVLLAALPGLPTLALVVGVLIAREALVRALFAAALRRSG
ncbi:MAG: hypothetical protein IT323_10665 [Anaerolineae bacterium]|nr:hypothetical protein [Anaerolineae bacterium]